MDTSDFLKRSRRAAITSKFVVNAYRPARLFYHIYQKNDFAFTKQLGSGFILRGRFTARALRSHRPCSIVIRKISANGFSKRVASRKCPTVQDFGQYWHLNYGRSAIGNVRERCHEHPRSLPTHTDARAAAA